MYDNAPDDWACYYTKCEACGTKYHLSEGGCECYCTYCCERPAECGEELCETCADALLSESDTESTDPAQQESDDA